MNKVRFYPQLAFAISVLLLTKISIIQAETPDYEVTILSANGYVSDCFGSIQAGAVNNRAVIWFGTPGSNVDVHPEGFFDSRIVQTSGTEHVGFASTKENEFAYENDHAILWKGNSGDFVDLHPEIIGDVNRFF